MASFAHYIHESFMGARRMLGCTLFRGFYQRRNKVNPNEQAASHTSMTAMSTCKGDANSDRPRSHIANAHIFLTSNTQPTSQCHSSPPSRPS